MNQPYAEAMMDLRLVQDCLHAKWILDDVARETGQTFEYPEWIKAVVIERLAPR